MADGKRSDFYKQKRGDFLKWEKGADFNKAMPNISSEAAARAWLQANSYLRGNLTSLGRIVGEIMERYPNIGIPPTLLRLVRRTPVI